MHSFIFKELNAVMKIIQRCYSKVLSMVVVNLLRYYLSKPKCIIVSILGVNGSTFRDLSQ